MRKTISIILGLAIVLWLTLPAPTFAQRIVSLQSLAHGTGTLITDGDKYKVTGVLVILRENGEAEFSQFAKLCLDTIIAPDLRGLGQSSREKTGYDKKTAAVDIHELVKSLGYKDIYLVGHDIGMMVAYAYVAQFSSEVRKLALLDAPIPGVGDVWEKIYTTPALWYFHFVNSPIALELVNGRERVFLEHVWQSFGGDLTKFSEEEKRIYAQSYGQPGVMRDAFEYFKAFEPTDAADNREFAKTKLPMPLLVIEGEKGMNGVLAIQAALISDHLKAIKFTSGHWLMEEKPAETSAALKDFFGN
jgi:pimeloyl-ACP methyl ester carboxylesterase